MRIRRLLDRFAASPTSIKIAITAVVLAWTVALAALIAGAILVRERPGQALQPVPDRAIPGIVLEPAAGPPGTSVTVRGQGWEPGSVVLIYPAAPGGAEPPSYAAAGSTADEAGRFTTRLVVPSEPGWANPGQATILARAADNGAAGNGAAAGASAQADFGLEAAPVPPTPEPATTSDASPDVTPTPTQEPQPPTASAVTDLNVRGGPGVAYPVLGVLRAGQSAEIIGASPDGDWLQIKVSEPADTTEPGWISARYVTAQNAEDLPEVAPPPLPATETPAPEPTSTHTPAPTATPTSTSTPLPTATPTATPEPSPTTTPEPSPTPTATATTTSTPDNQAPAAVIAAPTTAVVSQTVRFDGTGSSDPEGQILSYDWDFGDGTVGAGITVTHAYTEADSYRVTLTVADDGGLTDEATHEIEIGQPPPANLAPTAVFSGPVTAAISQTVQFDGSGSSDPDGQIVSYDWDFGDGAVGAGITVTHLYTEADSYRVALTVTDDGGLTDQATQTIRIGLPPTAALCAPTSALVSQTLRFDASASTDLDGRIQSYDWDFGNGVASQAITATQVYTQAGSYTTTLTVADDDGLTGVATQTLRIDAPSQTNTPPGAVLCGPATAAISRTVQFDAGGSIDDGLIAGYEWDFGDGAIGQAITVTHLYTQVGSYPITITVRDDGNLTSLATRTLRVGLAPTALLTAPITATVSQTVGFDASGSADTDGTLVGYGWAFGDGNLGRGITATHVYTQAGAYPVVLTVTDDDGLTGVATHTLQIDLLAPAESRRRP
jgi:PKD repeat protein